MAGPREVDPVHKIARISKTVLPPRDRSRQNSFRIASINLPADKVETKMSQVIDMTSANPYLEGKDEAKKEPTIPVGPDPKLTVSFNPATLATIQALTAGRNNPQHQSQQPYEDDMDQTMKSANSLISGGSLFSFMDQDDDQSSSSWSDSEDEGDSEYVMYAPVGNASRGHLLRPMSVDQITALAMVTGAKKPSALQNIQSLSNLSQSAHGSTAPGPLSRGKSCADGPPLAGHRSMSMPSIAPQLEHYRQMKAALSSKDIPGDPSAPKKPDDLLKAIMTEKGQNMEYCSYTDAEDFFLKVQPQHVEAFQQDIISAVRGKNVESLKALHQQGKMLQCCNKFGESIVHMACRQSSAQVLEYLMGEPKVNIRVCCDSGRTPLHDACWTTAPDFDIIKILIKECPDFLRIKDKRGFSPLAYVPHGQWSAWGDFLEKNKDLLVFRKLG